MTRCDCESRFTTHNRQPRIENREPTTDNHLQLKTYSKNINNLGIARQIVGINSIELGG